MSDSEVPYYKHPRFWVFYAVVCTAFIAGSLKGDDLFEHLGYTYFGQEKPRVVSAEVSNLSTRELRELAAEYLELARIPGVQGARSIDCRTVGAGYIINVFSERKLVAQAWVSDDPSQQTRVNYLNQ